MFGFNYPKKPFDIVKEIQRIKQCLCNFGLNCAKPFDLSKLNEGQNDQVLTVVNNTISWNDVRYVQTFSIADWVGNNIAIPATIHQRGVDPIIQVFAGVANFALVGEEFVEKRVNSVGEVKIVLLIPTVAFDGKIIII